MPQTKWDISVLFFLNFELFCSSGRCHNCSLSCHLIFKTESRRTSVTGKPHINPVVLHLFCYDLLVSHSLYSLIRYRMISDGCVCCEATSAFSASALLLNETDCVSFRRMKSPCGAVRRTTRVGSPTSFPRCRRRVTSAT